MGNPLLGTDSNYDLSFVKDTLRQIGSYAKAHGHRLTMHPGQYVQLGSPNVDVVNRSIVDLANHVQLFEMLGYGPSDGSVCVIHGGGTFDNKQQTLDRWSRTYLALPTNIRKYIALENDEFGYSVTDLLPFCEHLRIPFCLDIFHNKISADRIPITQYVIRRVFDTWVNHGSVPKIHVSEQQPGLKKGAHSKTIDRLPLYLFRLPTMFETPVDIMLEVKDKEVSVFKIYHKYFDIRMTDKGVVTYVINKKVQTKLGLNLIY